MEKGFKYRIYPTKEQEQQLKIMFDAKRFVWNYFLALNKKRLDNKEYTLKYNEMSSLLTQIKKENTWLKQCEKSIMQNTLKDLAKSLDEFFKKKKGFPKFKSYKDNYKSCKINFTTTTAGGNIRVKEKEIKHTKNEQ